MMIEDEPLLTTTRGDGAVKIKTAEYQCGYLTIGTPIVKLLDIEAYRWAEGSTCEDEARAAHQAMVDRLDRALIARIA